MGLSNDTPSPSTIVVLENLRRNAHLGKHKHFIAAARNRSYHIYYGAPVVIINVLLGSLLFANLTQDLPEATKWIGAFLALIAAGFSGIQTFFNFQKTFEAHRRIGNQYLMIARECECMIALYADGLVQLRDLSREVKKINKEYSDVNIEAEAFPTSNSDYEKALTLQKAKMEEYKTRLRIQPVTPSNRKTDIENKSEDVQNPVES